MTWLNSINLIGKCFSSCSFERIFHHVLSTSTEGEPLSLELKCIHTDYSFLRICLLHYNWSLDSWTLKTEWNKTQIPKKSAHPTLTGHGGELFKINIFGFSVTNINKKISMADWKRILSYLRNLSHLKINIFPSYNIRFSKNCLLFVKFLVFWSLYCYRKRLYYRHYWPRRLKKISSLHSSGTNITFFQRREYSTSFLIGYP